MALLLVNIYNVLEMQASCQWNTALLYQGGQTT